MRNLCAPLAILCAHGVNALMVGVQHADVDMADEQDDPKGYLIDLVCAEGKFLRLKGVWLIFFPQRAL